LRENTLAGTESGSYSKNILIPIVLTAIATFIVALAAPIAVNYFKTPELKLQYYVQDTLPFKTESQEIAIYQVELKNEGSKLLEGISCRITVTSGKINQTSISSSDIIQYDKHYC